MYKTNLSRPGWQIHKFALCVNGVFCLWTEIPVSTESSWKPSWYLSRDIFFMYIWGKLRHEMIQGCPESAGVHWWLLRSKCPFPALDMFSFLSSHIYLFSGPQTHYSPFLHCPIWFPIFLAPMFPQDHFIPFTAWARQSLTKLSAKQIALHVRGSAVCSEFGKTKNKKPWSLFKANS